MYDEFDIHVNTERNLIILRIQGAWTKEVVLRFSWKMRTAIELARGPTGNFLCLTDARLFPVQSKDIADLLEAFLKEPGLTAIRTAVITHSAISRLQASRIGQASDHRAFEEESVALSWLVEEYPI